MYNTYKAKIVNGKIETEENVSFPNGTEVLIIKLNKLSDNVIAGQQMFSDSQSERSKNFNKDEIVIYTDGSCLGNPGKGGYAAILIHNKKEKEISGGYKLTTNNRMELLSVIKALQEIKSSKKYNITVYSDSQYLTNAIGKGWLKKWKASNWIKKGNIPVPNSDLWEMLIKEMSKQNVRFNWIEGHSGNLYNEKCDLLAKEAASSKNLPRDIEYEKSINLLK